MTSLAVNLATSLAAAEEHETILLDFDLIFGSVDACLDIVTDNTLYTVLQNFDRLDLTLLKRSMTRHASGLYVLPHPVAIEDVAKIDPETLQRLLGLLKAAFGTLVIDTSKGLQSSDFVAFEIADVILMVDRARPDLPAEHRPAARTCSSSSTAWPIGSSWSSTAPARATRRSASRRPRRP